MLRDAFAPSSFYQGWDMEPKIKQNAPLFAAFDRPHYQKLLPTHLHEVLTMPDEIIEHFESGSFVCSVIGKKAR